MATSATESPTGKWCRAGCRPSSPRELSNLPRKRARSVSSVIRICLEEQLRKNAGVRSATGRFRSSASRSNESGRLLQPDRFATLTRATVQRTALARLPRWSRDRVIGRASGFDARTSAARRWSSARRCSSAERACARKLVRSEAILLLPQLPVTTVGSGRWIGPDRWDRRGGCEARTARAQKTAECVCVKRKPLFPVGNPGRMR